MSLHIHGDIKEKLNFFYNSGKIPNIIFHGPNGGGKKTLIFDFIQKIYKADDEIIKSYVTHVNCAHGKGIKFVREELKFFSKTHINLNGTGHFKSILLTNADKLTIDAQSALRRCIELFSHTTKFFIVVENRDKLLRPILSRFCEIFVQVPLIQGKHINLHTYECKKCFHHDKRFSVQKRWLHNYMKKLSCENFKDVCDVAVVLYEKGYSGIDIANYIESNYKDSVRKYMLLLAFHKVKREFRSEKMLIIFMLNFMFFRSDIDLENMSFM